MGVGGGKLEHSFVKTNVKLGTGSFGTVWRGLRKIDGKPVAIKEISKLGPGGRKGAMNYEKEVRMMRSIQHPNVVGFVSAIDESEQIFFLVLEYCDGGDVADKIRQLGSNLSTAMAADWTKQILLAVCALHRVNIVHLDIKPGNFLIAHNSDIAATDSAAVLKLADFGLATVLSKADEKLFFKCGTPAFMAPEVHEIDDEEGYSKPADLWAVGIILYMLLHGGNHPFMSGAKLDKEKLLQGKTPKTPGRCSLSRVFSNDWAECGKDLERALMLSYADLRPIAERALEHKFVCPEGDGSLCGALSCEPQRRILLPAS